MRGTLTAARLLTLVFFLVLIAVTSYWALQILAPRPAIAPSASVGDNAAPPNLASAAVLFGSPNAVTAGAPPPSNIQVSGILEAGPQGVVILSVDGKPGTFYGVGSSVTEGTSVKSVALDKVVLDQRGRLIELKTPERGSLRVLSSGVGKAPVTREGSSVAPVPVRPAAPAPLPAAPPTLPRTQFQPPQPPMQPPQQPPQQPQQPQEQPQEQQLEQQPPDGASTQQQQSQGQQSQ